MRIVVKIGTSTLAHATGHLNIRRVEQLCKVMSDIKNAGHEVILVSSGAIGMGVGKLGLRCRPKDIPTKQAAAAVGQCELMYTYDRLFSQYSHVVAQILLTAEGSTTAPLPFSESTEEGYREENLHCRYRLQLSEDSARFTLRRTQEDLDALLEAAEPLGVTTAVGLWQELGSYVPCSGGS